MPAKVSVKKTTKGLKPAKKTVKKTAKKVTWDDIQEGFRELQELHKETERTLTKAHKETEKAIKEAQKNIGGLSNTLGSIVERLLTPGLPKKFKKLGYSFNRIASYSYAAGVYAQIDGMLENGVQAIAVEVKTKLRQSDIDDHILRMAKIQKHAYEHGDKRQFMGAMAAFIADENTRNYALKNGLFVIEPSGENVKVTKPEGDVRVW
jgi:hypothetical protein